MPAVAGIAVRDLGTARAALAAAAAEGVEVDLVALPDAVLFGGVGYWAAVEAALGHAIVVDCGDRAGTVMAGLRAGLQTLVFRGDMNVLARLQAQAAALGAVVAATTVRPLLCPDPLSDDERTLRRALRRLDLGPPRCGL